MAVLKAIWAIIVGTFMAAVIGGIYDYLRPGFIPDPAQYKFVYPWLTGASGFLAALIAVGIAGVRQPAGARSAVAQAPAAKPAPRERGATKPAVTGAADMPTFDIDKAMKEIKGTGAPTGSAQPPAGATSVSSTQPPASPQAASRPESGEVKQ